MKFSKADIEKITKTNPIEDSLLVFQADGATSRYVEYALVKMEGQLLTSVEIEQWIEAVPRFRDCYIYQNDQPVRIRLKAPFYPVEFVQLSGEQHVEGVMAKLAERVPEIDVQSPPLFRVIAFVNGNDTFIGLAYHHLLFDGISVQLAMRMFKDDHRFAPSDWRPNPTETDVVVDPVPTFEIEPLLPPPVQQATGYLRLNFRCVGRDYEDIMLKWLSFIQQASGSDEIVIGEVLSARNDSIEAQHALGYFIQTWPLIFKGNITLEKLRAVRNARIAVADDWVNRHVSPNCFDHVWVVEPSLVSEHESLFWSTPHYPLTLVLQPTPQGVELNFCWNLEKVDAQAARQIFESFTSVLKGDELPALQAHWPPPEPSNLLDRWERVVAECGAQSAVEDGHGNNWTYGELDARADELAMRLAIQPGDRVGVHVTYSAVIPLAFLAVLKRGGIYVPLDPTVTQERWQYILEDAGINLVISDLSNDLGKPIVHPTEAGDSVLRNFERHQPAPTETAYLIYTSGTTGQPKGCAVHHENLSNLFQGTRSLFEFNPSDRWVLAHSYGFDFSTWEIWGSLLSGAKLFIPPRETIQDTFAFHDFLSRHEITILNQTPKAFENLMLVDESAGGLHAIRHIIFGGDKLHPDRLSGWMERYCDCVLTNMYGITETTVHVTAKRVVQEAQSNIGVALPGYTLQWVNDAGQPIPKGFIGEMHVYGRGVCNGYHGKPELTEQKFGSTQVGRFYRTGDLGWQIGDEAYYLGRKDRQIKVRGYRIELSEIEFQLQRVVPNCQFIAALHADQLVTFFKGPTDALSPEMFEGKLADYAIPRRFISVQGFPLNASGKVDEKALVALLESADQPIVSNSGDPAILSAIRDVLGDGVSPDRSFIQNGGDSIGAIRVVNKLRKAELTIAVADLFASHPISSLKASALIAPAAATSTASDSFNRDLGLAASKERFWVPLMEAQEGILFDCLRSDDPSLYVEQLTYELPATYSVSEILAAYEQVCRHNPLLLAVVDRQNEQYLLKIDRNAPVRFEEITDSEWDAYVQADFAHGFDLHSNLSRIAVLPGTEHHRLVWTHHHLILDGWSLGVFSQEILKALQNEALTHHDEFIQFACRTHSHPNRGNYWAEHSISEEAHALPPALPSRESERTYAKQSVFIPLSDRASIQEVGASLHAFCLTLWSSFLCTLYDERELVLGNVVSLRDDEHMESLGMYVRTLPFAYQHIPNQSFDISIAATSERLRNDETHKHERLGSSTNARINDHLFVFENYPVDHQALQALGVRIGDFQERTGAPWTTLVYPVSGGFDWHVMYDTAQHHAGQVEAVLSHFTRWADRWNWHEPIALFAEKFAREPQLIGPDRPLKNGHILDILKRDSRQPAISGADFLWAYGDVWNAAQSVAQLLQNEGLKDNEAVGIDVTTTRHFVSCILGVWLAGGVPAPVDKRYPEARKNFVYKAISARVVLHSSEDEIQVAAHAHPRHTFPPAAGFILSTSGSTGTPKVVVQSHACLLNLIQWNRSSFGMSDQDVILQLSSFGFDASFHEVLLALSLGATLVEVPVDARLDIHEIKFAIEIHQATQAWIPARLLNAVLEVDPAYFDGCATLRRIVTTGEALILTGGLKAFVSRSDVSLLNYYGPTETHVVTSLEITRANLRTQPPIGKVLDNTRIQLMDTEGRPVFRGLPGEIWVAGDPVAIGYHQEEDQNAAAFSTFEEERWYKTGDWGFLGSEGLLEFIGRKDSQLKIRGFRVEPLEVERTISEITGVSQCCVLAIDGRLHGFVVCGRSLDALMEESRNRLPDYMIPSHWHLLEAMPMNSNGKADRTVLLNIAADEETPHIQSDANWISTRVWKAVLGHEAFHPNASFDSVGGNSILLMKMQAWIEKELGLFVSIRDLLQHNTPESLESILSRQHLPEQNLPDRFPIHALQRGILILEAGQNLETRSPFWLGFKADLSQAISKKAWEQAISKLFDQYPQLQVMLEGELGRAEWVRAQDLQPFLEPASSAISTFRNALIRFVHVNESTIEVQWHHVLLDGLGIEVTLRNLMEILEGTFQKRPVSFQTLIHPSFESQAINIRTSGEKAQVLHTKMESQTLEAVNDFCQHHGLSPSAFWQCLAAFSHQTSRIAVADVSQHPGFPGMFTALEPMQFNLTSESPAHWVVPAATDGAELDVVANFMTIMHEGNWVKRLEVSQPTYLKYPHEWQFIVSGSQMDVSYYTAQTQSTAAQTFDTFQAAVARVLASGRLQPASCAPASEVFDEFDF